MNPLQRILDDRSRDLYMEALEQPPERRAEFLAQACAGDESLQRHLHELLSAEDEASALFRERDACSEKTGDRIERYKLLQKIGEGGFGTVWMAEQDEPVRRKVALKILKAGMDTAQVIGRFEAERQALAMMDHPHIARIFDGGATPQGRPYFAMELVKGVPITTYCDEAGLGMRERLELFVPVCQAVQHAHQKGIIHRDLKPSNVLVTLHDGAPVPKVIDFGIAKATQSALTERTVFTEFRQMLGTPEYMAPEQAALSGLDIDTRADVYSLGVLLYELLTGTRPFELKTLLQAGYAEMLRTLREVDPPKPSTRVSTLGRDLFNVAKHRRVHPKSLGALVRGDLDWISMKALEKERGRRYDTAAALAEDVLRHLRHEPVLAGPPSWSYRLRKYVRRHRFGVTAAAGIATALIAGAGIAAVGYLEALEQMRIARGAEGRAEAALDAERTQRQFADAARAEEQRHKEAAISARADAERSAIKSDRGLQLLASMLSGGDDPCGTYQAKGPNYPVRLMIADFERSLGGLLSDQPEIEAELRLIAAKGYLALGLQGAGEKALKAILEMDRERLVAFPEVRVETLQYMALLKRQQGRFDEAFDLANSAEQELAGCASDDAMARGITLQLMRSQILAELELHSEAEALASAALERSRVLVGDRRGALICVALNTLAHVQRESGNLVEAERLTRDTLAACKERYGEGHEEVAKALQNLAQSLCDRGALAEAERHSLESLDILERRFHAEHPAVASALHKLAAIRIRQKDPSGAEALLQRALSIRLSSFGADNPHLVESYVELARVARLQGKSAETSAHLEQARNVARRALENPEESSERVAVLLASAAGDLASQGALVEAEALWRDALAIEKRFMGHGHPRVAEGLCRLAKVLLDMDRLDEAESVAREALRTGKAARGEEDHDVAHYGWQLAMVQLRRGVLDEAEELLRHAIAVHQSPRSEEGTPPPAEQDELALVVAYQESLALVLRRRGRSDEAEALLREALETLARIGGGSPRQVARMLHVWAELLLKVGKITEAESRARDAVARREALHGGEHLDVAESLVLVAISVERQSKLAEAENAWRRVVAVRQSILGDGDEKVARSRNSLALVLHKRGQHAEAEDLLKKALNGMISQYGEKHREVAAICHNLGTILSDRESFEEAETYLRRALALRTDLFGEADESVADSLLRLALIRRDRGDLTEAETLLRRCLQVRTQALGEEHLDVASCLGHLAFVLRRRGEIESAEEHYHRALSIRKKKLGDGDPLVAQTLAGLARCLLERARFAEAEQTAREILAIEEARGTEIWRRYSAKALLGRALAGQGKDAESETLLVEACTHMKPPRSSRFALVEALGALIELYERQSRSDEARAWRERLQGVEKEGG